jgi:3-mercaptopyruvate sulfurtransferase SseA
MSESTTTARSWEDRARLFLKAEIKRADITYEELAKRLEGHGIKENAASIANKLARGTFAATFFLATMKAIGRERVDLSDF